MFFDFRSIDFALEWLQLESGKALYKQNDEANSTYVVLSGRLRSVIRQENSKKTLVGKPNYLFKISPLDGTYA